MHCFMLAWVSSNVEKTTVTMGVLAALKRLGQSVVPFKTGPDYIDPMFPQFVTGHPSTNLDTWLVEPDLIRTLCFQKLQEDDVGVVEGVMGLYDGHSTEDTVGSSAYLAKTLGIPVFLIIDGRGMSLSAAALVKGYADFDPELTIAGVIINRIASQSHYALLKEGIEQNTGIPCVGWLPDNPELAVGSRHLGLIPADELKDLEHTVSFCAALVQSHVDLKQMLALSQNTGRPAGRQDPFDVVAGLYAGLRIGYAWDKAFNFYYYDNLEALKKCGVTMVPFSPLEDKALPEVDGLYLGGGFPEVFGREFEANAPFRKNLLAALLKDLPCYAECGGLMVLTESLQTKTGERTAGVGFFKARTVMTRKLQRFGYVTVETELSGKPYTFRAHEFHHSLVESEERIPRRYRVKKNERTWKCGYAQNRTLAAYPHVHFYSNPDWLLALLDEVKKAKDRKNG